MSQQFVFKNQAFGLPGELHNDSPFRILPAFVKGATVAAVNAFATINIVAIPAEGDTIAIGDEVITYATVPASIAAAIAEITGALTTAGTFSTTVSGDSILVTSTTVTGAAGNDLPLTWTGTFVVSTGFSGGNDAFYQQAEFGRILSLDAFSEDIITSDPDYKLGYQAGREFGVLVNPKERVNAANLETSYVLPDDSQGAILSEGEVIVRLYGTVAVGSSVVPQVENATGKVSAIAAAGTSAAGFTKLPNARFVGFAANPGNLAVLQLNHA